MYMYGFLQEILLRGPKNLKNEKMHRASAKLTFREAPLAKTPGPEVRGPRRRLEVPGGLWGLEIHLGPPGGVLGRLWAPPWLRLGALGGLLGVLCGLQIHQKRMRSFDTFPFGALDVLC